jgi:hypothetical protein
MTDEYGICMLLHAKLIETQRQMDKNLVELLYGDDKPRRILSTWQRLINFFNEIRRRFSNAYDCLIKGVDPYDGY